MANLYLSDYQDNLAQYFTGDPIAQANKAISDKLEQSLKFALGQVPTDAIGNLSVTATSIQYTLKAGSVAPAAIKVTFTGLGFPDGATSLSALSSDTDYSISSVSVIFDSASGTNFTTPVSTVTLNTNIAVARGRMTALGLNGFTVAAGDVKVQLSGTLTTTLGTGTNGNLSVTALNFNDAGLSVTYDTDPSATNTKLAQIYLKGNFAINAANQTEPLTSASITEFGLKTFPGTDLAAAPVHYFYGDNLGITLSELRSIPSNSSSTDVLRAVFEGATDTVYTMGSVEIPEGFENVVIRGAGGTVIKANGLSNSITGSSGNDGVDGGAGTDTFKTQGTFSQSTGVLNRDGSIILASAGGGSDRLNHVEKVQFTDATKSYMEILDSAQLTYVVNPLKSAAIKLSDIAVGDGVINFTSQNQDWYGSEETGLILSSGKLLSARNIKDSSNLNSSYKIAVERFNLDGTPDSTFGEAGKANISGFASYMSMVESKSGEVFLVESDPYHYGSYYNSAGWKNGPTIWKINNSGVVVDSGMNCSDLIYKVNKLLMDEKGGVTAVGTDQSGTVKVIKFTKDGGLDAAFGNGTGIASLNIGNSSYDNGVQDAVQDSTGHLYFLSDAGWDNGFYLTKLTTAGLIDQNFGTKKLGLETTQNPLGIALDKSDNVFVAYYTSTWTGGQSSANIEVAKFLPNGNYDLSFGGGDGRALIEMSNDSSWAPDGAQVFKLDSLNQPVLAFNRFWGTEVVRLKVDGSIDKVFTENKNGLGLTDTGADPIFDFAQSYAQGYIDRPKWIGIDAENNTFVAVKELNWNGESSASNYSIAKFNYSGELDKNFDENQNVSYSLANYDGTAPPSWVSLDTTNGSPKLLVSNAPSSASGHHYFVLTATGSSTSSQSFDLLIKQNSTPTGNVTISGIATQGQTLTAANNLADLDGLGPILYTWKSNGLTIGTGSTYTLTQAEVGKKVTATANYSDNDGTSESMTSVATQAIVNTNDTPTGSVYVTGIAKEGKILIAGNSLSDLDGLGNITYTWKTDGLVVGTGANYSIKNADVGKSITLSANYVDGYGKSEQVDSSPSKSVQSIDAPDAKLYLSDSIKDLQQYFVGDPIAQANQAISEKLQKSLQLAFGQVPTNAIGNLSVTSTSLEYTLKPGAVVPAGVKLVFTGTGFPSGATSLSAIAADTDYSISSMSVIFDSLTGSGFTNPVSTVTLNTNITVKGSRMTALGLSGFSIAAGDIKVQLNGALTTALGTGADGNVSLNSLNFNNAGLSITYDTDPSAATTKLAQLYLRGSFGVSSATSSEPLTSAQITDFGFKTFGGADDTAAPVHYFYGENLDLSLSELQSIPSTASAADLLRAVFEGAADTVYTSASIDMPEGFENVVMQGSNGKIVTANGLNNFITGSSGNDYVDGVSGNDTVIGALGADTVKGGAGADSLSGGAGDDELFGGVGQDTLLGDSGADTLYGGDGNDSVVGGAGNDLIIGGDGAGDDTYAGGDGIDTVKYTSATAAIVVDLAASSNQAHSVSADNAGIGVDQLSGIENVIAGNYDDTLSGDSKDNTFTGGAGNDTLSGGSGSDTAVYSGARSNYTITTTAGGLSVQDNRSDGDGTDLIAGIEWLKFSDITVNLTGLNLIGSAFANRLSGDAGNDTLYGAGGIDVLDGKDGSDLYLMGAGDHPAAEIKDTGASGVDELRFISTTAATLTLFAGDTGIEKVVMGTGSLSTAITSGKAALNVDAGAVLNSLTIVGNDGANSIKGTSQADTISGGAGNDTLSGGAGADNLDGGLGDDSYVIDDAGDQVTEAVNAGTDLVQSSVSYALGAYLEKLTLTGAAAINGTGNSLANTITGNAGANSLDGGDGNDTLMGGDGQDSLTGGAGSDVFKLSSAASQNMDTILDFVSGEDKIYLSKAAFAKVGLSGGLKANAFYSDSNATAGHDADDRIIYNNATGALYYDADGSGSVAAVQIAIIGVGNHPTMGAADLVVY